MSTSVVFNLGQKTLAELRSNWQRPVPMAKRELAVAKGLDLFKLLGTNSSVEVAHGMLFDSVSCSDRTRLFAPDIKAAKFLAVESTLSVSHQYTLASLWR